MNDTTRQVGGAVGVAVLGSVLASQFGANMSNALKGTVPAQLLGQARDSIGAALGLARDVPAARPFAPQLVDAARQSFISGLHTSVVVGAVIMLLGAAAVVRWLPARAPDDDRELAYRRRRAVAVPP